MSFIINVTSVFLLFVACLSIIKNGINKALLEELKKQKEINRQMFNLLQIEKNKENILYATINHIKNTLSLLKLKDCPEEEFKNIPMEIIDWIEKLQKASTGENNGVHK